MNDKINMLSNIRETKEYQELELLHSSKTELIRKQDLSSTVKGRLNINSQISDTLTSAKDEVIICATTNELKKRIKLLEPMLKQINNSEVKVTIALNGPEIEIKALSDRLGVKAKKVDVNASFYLADKKEIVFMLNEAQDSQEQLAVWFASPFFVQSFVSLFDIAMKRLNK